MDLALCVNVRLFQGLPCNNAQTTHPFVGYYSQNEIKGHKSNYLKHVTIAVHLFQTRQPSFLWTGSLTKIYYISDSADSHDKMGRCFSNLCYHKSSQYLHSVGTWQYNMAEVQMMGLGEQLNRQQKRQMSDQNPHEKQVMTLKQFYEWAFIMIPCHLC
jgi:hypothetical protein